MQMKTCLLVHCTVLLVLFGTLNANDGTFNFFMPQFEVNRILGLPAELYYVRDGLHNFQMLNSVIFLPPQIDTMYFSWQSLAGKSLPYTLDYKISNEALIPSVAVNISTVGVIPSTGIETFSVTLPCTRETGTAFFTLFVNVTLSRINLSFSTFSVTRKKSCAKSDVFNANPILLNAVYDEDQQIHMLPVNMLYLANVLPIVILVFTTMLMCSYYFKNENEILSSMSEMAINNADYQVGAQPRIPVPLQQNVFMNSDGRMTIKRLPHLQALTEEQSIQLKNRIQSITTDRQRVKLSNTWMEGTFGRIFLGTLDEQDILIKTVSEQASNTQISLLIIESMVFHGLVHDNLLTIQNICVNGQTPPFMIFPFEDYQNVKRFLQKCKMCADGAPRTLTTQEVIQMVLQVVRAMQYLHANMIVHKDLAARNCIVDEKLHVKITDNALSRDLFPADYNCLGDNENRPIKWLAIESLKYNLYIFQSDVWAFGVLLWEFMTLGQQPYVEIDPFEMEAYLKDGYRLAQPVNCPDELFALMAYCWALKTEERPSFKQLEICLTDFQMQLNKYV